MLVLRISSIKRMIGDVAQRALLHLRIVTTSSPVDSTALVIEWSHPGDCTHLIAGHKLPVVAGEGHPCDSGRGFAVKEAAAAASGIRSTESTVARRTLNPSCWPHIMKGSAGSYRIRHILNLVTIFLTIGSVFNLATHNRREQK
jgi:hypothetical protein